MSEDFYVYVHSRLTSGEPFYVGKGRGDRFRDRCRNNQHWRNIVAKDGGFHYSFAARGVDEEFAFLVECELIDKYRRAGARLANRTKGGEGPTGYRWTEAQRERMRKARTGTKLSEETRRLIAIAGTGRVTTQETKEKLRSKFAGRPIDAETKAKISASLMGRPSPKRGLPGKPHSAETRAKMSAMKRGKPPNNKGKKMNPEMVALRSIAIRAGWARRKAKKEAGAAT